MPTEVFAQETRDRLTLQGIDRRLNVSPEARTSEILCKPNAGTKSAVDPAVYPRFINGTRSALCSLLLTSGPTPFCLCKPFSCKACPGMGEQSPRLTRDLSAVDIRFICGTAAALCSWLLTNGPSPSWLCKPFFMQGMSGNLRLTSGLSAGPCAPICPCETFSCKACLDKNKCFEYICKKQFYVL